MICDMFATLFLKSITISIITLDLIIHIDISQSLFIALRLDLSIIKIYLFKILLPLYNFVIGIM